MNTFLPLVVYLLMTLVMCPNVLAGVSFKEENDVYAANVERMFLNEDEKRVIPVGDSYHRDVLDEPSMNSVKSFQSYHSHISQDSRSDV